MRRSSPTSSWLCSALATADSSSLSHGFAAARGVKARIERASATSLPRMWSQTRRALRAEVRTYFAFAWTRIPGSGRRRRSRLAGLEATASCVALSASGASPSAPSGFVPSGLRSSGFTRRRFGLASVASAASLSMPVASAATGSSSVFFLRGRLGLGSGWAAASAGACFASLASSGTADSSTLPFCGSWGLSGVIAPGPWSRARGRCASARTRRACGRPSPRRRTRARACARRGRRSCGRPSRGRSSRRATRCGSSSWSWRRSWTRCGPSDGPRPTGPSWMNETSAAALLATAAAADDVAVGLLALLAGAVADRRHAPGRLRVVAQRGGALAAAMRVVNRVHGGAARLRAHAHMALAAGLAHRDVLVVGVADDTDGGAALGAHHAHLAGGQAQRGHVALLGHQLDARAGGAGELAAAAGLELDVVHERADRHRGQRHRVADLDVLADARDDGHAHAQAVRREDVGLDAVDVVQQRDVGRPVGVVLDRGDLRRDVVARALEVDPPVQALGAATAVAGGLAPVGVAAAGLLEPLDEGLLGLGLRDLGVVGVRDEPTAGRGGLGLADRHGLELGLEALEDRDGVALAHLHDRRLPGARAAAGVAAALRLRGDLRRAHSEHGHAEQLLDGLLDLRLVRVRMDAERVLVGRRQHVGLLGDDGPDDHLGRIHQALASSRPMRTTGFFARSVSVLSATSEMSSVAWPTRSATPQASVGMTLTPARLRKDLAAADSSAPSTTSTEPARRSAIMSAAFFVDGASKSAR